MQDTTFDATFTEADHVTSRSWQWARSTSRNSGWTDISGETSSTYQPVFDDIGYYLRVTVNYNDPHGTDRTLRAISDQSVIRNQGSNKPPKFPSSETGERTIPENSGVGTRVTHPVPGENAAVVAEDEDDDQLTYSLSGDDSDKYEISGSGQITAALGAVIDYEDSAGPSHFLTVIARDLFGAQDTIDVTITITDVNEAPIISGLESIQFLENDTHDVASYNAFDLEGDDVSWLALTGSDASYFILDDGRLRFKQPPNFEARANSNYQVRLRASDGMFTGILNVTVNVQDVNEPPAIIGETDIVFTENSSNRVAIYNASDPEAPTNPVIWSLGGSDANQFELRGSIRGRRDLYFNSAPNFEDRSDQNRDNEFEVTIEASDGRQRPSGLGTLQVTIDLTDLDEPESLLLSSDVPVQDISLTATMTVADTVSSRRWQWARSTSMSSGWTDISGEIYSSYQPVFDDIGYYLRVTVTYNDPHGTDKTLRAISDQSVIRKRGSNRPPMFPSSETGSTDDSRELRRRNSTCASGSWRECGGCRGRCGRRPIDLFALGRRLGQVRDQWVWSDHSGIGGSNRLRGPGGALAFLDGDREGSVRRSRHNRCNHHHHGCEAPEIDGLATHYFPEHTYIDIGVYRAIDPENDMISWTLSGDDAGHFSVTDGRLRFVGDPDYEAHADLNMDDIFKVTLNASDGQLTGTFDVAVTLQGLDEPPEISGLAEVHVKEGGDLYVTTFKAIDPEGATIEWSISGDDRDDFTITDGELNRKQPSDYEAPTDRNLNNTYEINVRASDGKYSAQLEFALVVTDEDEPPIISGLESVQFLENATRDVETYSAADPERQAVNWLALDGSDASDFILVDGTTQIQAAPQLRIARQFKL